MPEIKKELAEAIEQLENGQGTTFKDIDDFEKWLDEL